MTGMPAETGAVLKTVQRIDICDWDQGAVYENENDRCRELHIKRQA